MKLVGKAALVTGASVGIGRAIALALAQEGAGIAVNHLGDAEGAGDTVKMIQGLGGRGFAVEADVRKMPEIEAMVEATVREFGRLDILVNNAAIPGWKSVFEVTEEDWDSVLDTNLKGPFFLSIAAARHMRRDGGGSIINISSCCGELMIPRLAAYAASKGGLAALTKQLALDLAPFKIRVNSFGPGPTLVPRNLKDDPDYDANWGAVVPLGRAARAEEMGPSAVFLASDDSSFVTGQTFYVDGGLTIASQHPKLQIGG